MIIGSGLLGRAFSASYIHRNDVCVYAAGVSNSNITDKSEFAREKRRLEAALAAAKDVSVFVYFGTCSVLDPEAYHTQYVQHKLAMERLVQTHSNYLILRLPQVAGRTPNPHTLLNFVYSRIIRSEAFVVWRTARRNIIDIDDVVTLGGLLIENRTLRQCTINLANSVSYLMSDIVAAMESVVHKSAVYTLENRGRKYLIDVTLLQPLLVQTQICFDNNYLKRVLDKYYGNT